MNLLMLAGHAPPRPPPAQKYRRSLLLMSAQDAPKPPPAPKLKSPFGKPSREVFARRVVAFLATGKASTNELLAALGGSRANLLRTLWQLVDLGWVKKHIPADHGELVWSKVKNAL